jgi:hypothetical protein
MKIRARTTLTVEFIRTCIFFIFILCVNTIASMINTNPFFDFTADQRCRGCETKKPLRLKREEEAWLEARRVRKEQEEAEQRRVDEERLRLLREEEQKEGTDKAGAWDCTLPVFDV